MTPPDINAIEKKTSVGNSPNKERENAYYAALVQAWVGTRMEKDKSLLTLATAGVGFCVTVLTTIGASNFFEIILYALAIICFLISIISSIKVFDLNADLVKQEIEVVCKGASEPSENKWLTISDKIMFRTFISGVVLLIIIGLISGYNKMQGASENMNKPKNESNNSNTNMKGGLEIFKRSLAGISGLRPSNNPPQERPSSSDQSSSNDSQSDSAQNGDTTKGSS